MSQPFLTEITVEIAEKVTARITGTITDDVPQAIPSSSLTTLTVTLYNQNTGTILNGRNGQDIKNANQGTVDSTGLVTLVLGPADNALESQLAEFETHVAQFVWTYNSGAATGRALVEFVVRNFTKVA